MTGQLMLTWLVVTIIGSSCLWAMVGSFTNGRKKIKDEAAVREIEAKAARSLHQYQKENRELQYQTRTAVDAVSAVIKTNQPIILSDSNWNIKEEPEEKWSFISQAESVLKSRELSLHKFEAYQECPKCQQSGFWLIDSIDETPWDLIRECGNCEHKWTQAK